MGIILSVKYVYMQNKKSGIKRILKNVRNLVYAGEKKNREKLKKDSNIFYHKNKDYYKEWNYKKKYGMSLNDYEKIYQEQRGHCLICDLKCKKLSVDHCHNTGQIRGLLCTKCNTAIGKLNDDPVLLDKAAKYLRGILNGQEEKRNTDN